MISTIISHSSCQDPRLARGVLLLVANEPLKEGVKTARALIGYAKVWR